MSVMSFFFFSSSSLISCQTLKRSVCPSICVIFKGGYGPFIERGEVSELSFFFFKTPSQSIWRCLSIWVSFHDLHFSKCHSLRLVSLFGAACLLGVIFHGRSCQRMHVDLPSICMALFICLGLGRCFGVLLWCSSLRPTFWQVCDEGERS